MKLTLFLISINLFSLSLAGVTPVREYVKSESKFRIKKISSHETENKSIFYYKFQDMKYMTNMP